jgi:ABC-type microcin C transport system permease subunit YejB
MSRLAMSILFVIVSVLLFAGCAFFAYYTVRLLYVNLTAANISPHRQSGMYIGAVAFPIISLAFGCFSYRSAKAALTNARATRTDRRNSIE